MARGHIALDNTVVPETTGNGKPVEIGHYLATIMPTEKDATFIKERPAANSGPNANITALAIRVRLDEGQSFAGRNLFVDIPLARKWAATNQGQYPDGAPVFLFFQFFRALGYDVDAPEGFDVPEDSELLGQKIEVVVSHEEDRRDAHLPKEQRRIQERIRFINEAKGEASLHVDAPKPARTVGAAAGGFVPPQQGQTQGGFVPPQQQGFVPPQQGGFQPPQAQPQYAPQQAGVQYAQAPQQGFVTQQQVQQAPQGWQPNPADVQYAQAAAQGRGSVPAGFQPGAQTF